MLPRRLRLRLSLTRGRWRRLLVTTGLVVTGIRLGRTTTGIRATGPDLHTRTRIGLRHAITATVIIPATGAVNSRVCPKRLLLRNDLFLRRRQNAN